MTDKQSNYYDMFKAVDEIYNANQAAIDAVVARATAFATHKANITAIESKAGLSSTDPTGVTQDKRLARETLNNTTYSIIQMVLAYAISISDNALKAEMDAEISDLQKLKDDEVSAWAQHRLNLVNPIIASLVDYSIDAAAITAWQDAIDAHTAALALPRAAVVARSGHKEDLQNLTNAANIHLRETMDTLMKPIRISDPSLYYNYQQARVIIDRGTSGSGDGGDPEPPTNNVTISVFVTDANTTLPLENVEVQLNTIDGSESIFTDIDGNASISFVAEETIDITFDIIFPGYQNPSIIHTIEPGQTYNFDFPLTPEA